MRLFTRRAVVLWSLALAVALGAALRAVIRTGSSQASPVLHATQLAKVRVTPAIRAEIAQAARESGSNPGSVVELGGMGSGTQRHGLLAATDASGATVVSFLSGFAMSDFVAGSRYANASHAMVVTESIEGPSTESRIVGIVGIATRAVERVTVQLANGTSTTLAVSRATGIPYQGFAYVSSDRSTFPTVVTAYNSGGHVLAQHTVDASPLCATSQPRCATSG